MSKLNIEFMDDNSGFYSKVENDLELEIMDLLNRYTNSELQEKMSTVSNEVFEQLSSLRETVFEWYPFKDNASILEVGAGMGALTGLFCEKAKKVISIEKKRSRAEIIRKRYADKMNLEVICDNIESMEIDEKFDYIIVHDILGYIRKYIKSENPYLTFIEKLKGSLNNQGTILIATENRLGLKYFSGAVEDYSYKFFTGLNNYDEYDNIKTLSKSELTKVCKLAGFNYIKFYYPFPDNIFATELFTDKVLECLDYGGEYKNTSWEQFNFFDEKRMFRTLQQEGIVTKFANSFIIELNLNNDEKRNNIIYYKPNTECKIFNRTGIVYELENENKIIIKKIDSARKILSNIQTNESLIENFDNIITDNLMLKCKRMDNYLNDFVDLAVECNVKENKWTNYIYSIFLDIANILRQDTRLLDLYENKFQHIYGKNTLNQKVMMKKNLPIEASCESIFIQSNSYKLFFTDLTDFYIPVDYIIWSIINSWYFSNVYYYKNARKKIKLNEIYDYCNLKVEDIDIFKKWYINAYKIIHENQDLNNHYKQKYNCNFIYPVDVVLNGDPIIEDLEIKNSNDLLNQLVEEKRILDLLRM